MRGRVGSTLAPFEHAPSVVAPTAVASATLENPRLLIMSGTDSVSDPLASTIRGNDGVGLYRARVARRG
ncbi:Uncharacterised protein [Mycobacteroides abscessus subsp. massiliense]|nr:Uncharacterised protein [Mycobacteroides abscessus]SKI68014.1 Uncharacterised protein [Mycobacteroides abscessus subsp. massiliense]CPY98126.1 Uncharacterised protein [Mycobacteroides abscessus]CPZ76224.1 Uncharacterised protein [Mycobacteroides abscessus]SKI90916.1 Uncharacterised protein [Mycobacteroides abscessus subsp. massiliense]